MIARFPAHVRTRLMHNILIDDPYLMELPPRPSSATAPAHVGLD